MTPEPAPTAETMDAPASGRGRLMAAEAAQAKPQFEGADAAAQAVHAAKPADALTTVLGSPAGSTLRRVARDLDSTDLLLGLARRRNRPARRLAAAQLSAAIDAPGGRKTGRRDIRGGVAAEFRRAAPRRAATKIRGAGRATPPARPRRPPAVGGHARPARDGCPRVGRGARIRWTRRRARSGEGAVPQGCIQCANIYASVTRIPIQSRRPRFRYFLLSFAEYRTVSSFSGKKPTTSARPRYA